uniref:Protein ZIP4 homolog n=1 Tax=Vombatus ursinus TaxID=29139 RepID=A0A4X2L380_VOMUR
PASDTSLASHFTSVSVSSSAVAQGDFQRAVTCIQRCKDMLMRLPRVPGYLSILCYNFGVETYYQKKFEEILRLLANTYLDWDWERYQGKALETVNLANEVTRLYCYFFKMLPAAFSLAAMKLLDLEVPLDFFLSTAKLLLEYGRDSVGFDFLKTVCNQFESSADVGKAFLLHIELLLQRKEDQLAKEKVEGILTAHHAGKELPPKILSWLHNILWDQAARNFEAQNYSEALHWYNCSLSFYPSGQMDLDFAKLQRNRASCYIHLKQLEKANEAVKEAERYDASNIFTQFIMFKIAVSRGSTDEALVAVDALEKSMANPAVQEKEMIKEENSTTAFLTLAAQFALENGQQDVAMRALEYLARRSQDVQQVLTYKALIPRSPFDAAHQRLAEPVAKEKLTLDVWINEAHWFRKIAWNLAMQCEKCPGTMRDFFLLSYKLSQFCPSEKAVLISQKTCLLMAAAADLELGRSASEASRQTEMLTHALEHIQGCKEIVNVLKLAGDSSKDPTENLLLLYEIEARAKLNDAGLTSLLESVWELPQLETKILETIASVVVEHPAHYPDVSKKALKKALCLYLQGQPIDAVKFSKCLHSFINLSLPDGVLGTDMCPLQEIWRTFEDALHVISISVSQAKRSYMIMLVCLLIISYNTIVFHHIHIPQLAQPFPNAWASPQFPILGHHKKSCCRYFCTCGSFFPFL